PDRQQNRTGRPPAKAAAVPEECASSHARAPKLQSCRIIRVGNSDCDRGRERRDRGAGQNRPAGSSAMRMIEAIQGLVGYRPGSGGIFELSNAFAECARYSAFTGSSEGCSLPCIFSILLFGALFSGVSDLAAILGTPPTTGKTGVLLKIKTRHSRMNRQSDSGSAGESACRQSRRRETVRPV